MPLPGKEPSAFCPETCDVLSTLLHVNRTTLEQLRESNRDCVMEWEDLAHGITLEAFRVI
jgi:hypothetical protein